MNVRLRPIADIREIVETADVRIVILFISALLGSCSERKREPTSSAITAACDVAVAYAETLLTEAQGRKLVFSDAAEPLPPSYRPAKWHKKYDQGEGEHPTNALLSSLAIRPQMSAVTACPALRARLDRYGIAYGKGAVQSATKVQASGNFQNEVVRISLPTISEGGTAALLSTSRVSAPEAGSGSLQYLTRERTGAWIAASWAPTWIA